MFDLEGKISIADVLTATISIVALVISLWQLMSNRPRLRINVSPNIIIFGDGYDKETKYVRFTITNIGIQPTWVNNVGSETYKTWFHWVFNKPEQCGIIYAGTRELADALPKKIQPSGSATILALQEDSRILPLWSSKYKTASISDSWSKKPIRVRLTRGFNLSDLTN
jgi:hypothetical protein